MEKIIKLINEIKIETSPLKKEALLLYLPKYIEDIFLKISTFTNIQEADYCFNILDQAQCLISILISHGEVELPDTLWKLYKDFDRIDDKEWREYLLDLMRN